MKKKLSLLIKLSAILLLLTIAIAFIPAVADPENDGISTLSRAMLPDQGGDQWDVLRLVYGLAVFHAGREFSAGKVGLLISLTPAVLTVLSLALISIRRRGQVISRPEAVSAFFLINGGLTVWLEEGYLPFITFTISLLYFSYISKREGRRLSFLSCLADWLAGYLFLTLVRWGIGSFFLGKNIAKAGLNRLLTFRSSLCAAFGIQAVLSLACLLLSFLLLYTSGKSGMEQSERKSTGKTDGTAMKSGKGGR